MSVGGDTRRRARPVRAARGGPGNGRSARPEARPEASPGGGWASRKEATRATLIDVAMELFAEQGFAATTVQQIAAAGEVSERTFFRYFESKDDLLLTDLVDVLAEAASCLDERPLDEPPLEAILQAVRNGALSAIDGTFSALASEIGPSLIPHPPRLVRVFMDWEDRVAEILVQRFADQGADAAAPEVRLRAAVIARVGTAATRSAIGHYRALPRSRRSGSKDLDQVLDAAFGIVSDGCPPLPRPPGRPRPGHPAGRTGRTPAPTDGRRTPVRRSR